MHSSAMMGRRALALVIVQSMCGNALPFKANSAFPVAFISLSPGAFKYNLPAAVRLMSHSKCSARRFQPVMAAKSPQKAIFIEIEHAEQEAWRLADAIQVLRQGGVGIVPTDTCYSFVTDVHSRKGVERLYQFVNTDQKVRKPLSLLCHSISQISQYTTATNIKKVFKMLKEVLPGPYTFIFPATNELPRMIIEHKKHTWKRKEIGVRVPEDVVLLDLLRELDHPLLVTSVPREQANSMQPFDAALALDRWESQVDFVVANGLRAEGFSSTVIDMTVDPPELLRQGEGDWELIQELLS